MTTPGIFAELEKAIAEAQPSDLPVIAGQLAQAQARLQVRLLSSTTDGNGHDKRAEPETFITIEQAAEFTGLTKSWLYHHTKGLKFRRDLSRKVVRLEEAGFRKWLTVASRR